MGGVFGGGDPYRDQQQQQQMTQGDYPMVTADWVPPAVGSDFYAPGGQGGYPTGAFDSAAYGGGYGGGSDSGGGGILNWLGSERGQRAMQQLGGFSAGLLQGSAPSLQPRNFSTGLGAGMAGMQQAGSQYYQDALRRAQAQEAQAKVADLQTWSRVMQDAAGNATGLPPGYMPGAPGMPGTTGGGTPPVQAPASAGGSGGGLGGWGPLAQPAIGALNAAGVSQAGQQAIMAHGLAEGGFNVPWRAGDNGNSFGHWQFNQAGQLPGYLDWAQGKGNPQDTGLQAQYVAQKVEEMHPGFSKVTDPVQAMSMVADFERYKGYQTNKRLGYLADAQKAMGGGELEQRMPIPPGPGRLADTAFQMPSNMAAGLGGPVPGPTGILPAPPAMPSITQPQPQPNTTLASGLRPPVAPIVTAPQTAATPAEPAAQSGSSAPAAAARVAAAGAPTLAEGDSIAYGLKKFGGLQGNPVGGRNPEQVLQNIDSNLKNDPNYYRGKTVMLSSGVMNGPGRIDLVPEQIQRIQDAGGRVILAGVDTGKFAGHNGTLAQMAAEAGVPFAGPLPTNDVHPGPDGYRQYLARVQRGAARLTGGEGSGSTFGPGTITPPDPGAGNSGAPAPVVGAAQPAAPPPAAVSPGAPPPAPASTLPGGPLAPPPAAMPAGAAPALARGTAPGMPQIPPEPLPAPPAPSPGAATAPPGPPPPSVPGAIAGAPPGAMPGAIAPPPVAAPPQPLPVPNLGQVQPPGAGGIPPYDVAAARRAQILSIAGAATGHQVPAYLAEQAGLPNKAVEQQWAMQKQLYGAQLQAAQSQWNAASELQKQQIAHQQGMETEQYKSELGIRAERFKQGIMVGPDGQIIPQPGYAPATAAIAGATAQAQKNAEALAEFDRPREYKGTDDNGKPFTYIATPRQMGAAPPASLGALPAPTGAPAGTPGTAGGYQSGIAPGRQEELTGTGKRLTTYADAVHNDAETAVAGRADLEFLSALGPRIALPGPMASAMQSFNRVRQSIFGNAVEPVASYEMAQQLMGGMMRTALRQSDPNPTERQQAMMLASMPTPASSAEGFQDGIRHMQGIADYKVFKRDALNAWMADPARNGSAAGFESSFRLSAIPFVLDRMSEQQQAKYIETLKAKDPRALERLRDQITAVKELNYTYRY